jgi:toxin ParE1/3/4
MKIIWMDAAMYDLRSLRSYIATDNPRAAKGQVLRITSLVMKLADFPFMGRPGRCASTRELVVSKTPYIVMYRLRGQNVEILRVVHSSRQWPDII